ncbi:MAG: stress responsive alpha-beta barrel protein, partial [Frondihabitans sp.]|nr:stress responsive alpha-beta barrel protein [Frondihabitans sp.]
ADFADFAALDAYQNHPDHLEVAALVRTFVTERAAIDYEY